jgi:hypothetical protein
MYGEFHTLLLWHFPSLEIGEVVYLKCRKTRKKILRYRFGQQRWISSIGFGIVI